MKHLIVKNIGAIKFIDINLNRVNVIMGPQSSGKSTIAKIISYCQWVEKRFILDGKFEYKFLEIFLNFHRIDISYFSEDSLIDYESDSVHIIYTHKEKNVFIDRKNKGIEFINHKNIYIPAERNFAAVIPNIGRYKETNDNIMNFLYDWFEAKKNYTPDNHYNILNLNVSYHNIKDDDTDKIVISESDKELSLTNASSGLQSVIPLLILVDYLSTHIFERKNLLNAKENDIYKNTIASFDELKQKINFLLENKDVETLEKVKKLSKELESAEEKAKEMMANFLHYNYTQFIIEEPEQNLFPITQRDLMYHLMSKLINSERKHNLLITTHSPYILYALNNCMMGYNVGGNIPKEEVDNFASKKSWINPKLVSVWEIDTKTGTLKNIKNSRTGTVDKHYFNEVMNEIMDEYYDMLDYLEL